MIHLRPSLKQITRGQRVLNTIRHLQLRQALYFILRRGVGSHRVEASPGVTKLRKLNFPAVLAPQHAQTSGGAYNFIFLNRLLTFPRERMDWNPRGLNRLWLYNLHYFDFLRDAKRSLQEKFELIDDWIAQNPQSDELAWEPYPTSLRIVNWCIFFGSLPEHEIKQSWIASLHEQAKRLEKNLELHILANHYFENIKALCFAGLFFDDADSARWLQLGQRELVDQLREQTLPDGGHYERSPQYHCILLEGYLDLYAVAAANPQLLQPRTLSALSVAIESGVRLLDDISTPDDDIPLFNDSASGITPPPSVIIKKAIDLGCSYTRRPSAPINCDSTGLYGWKSASDYFLIDCGDIGPAYQPGHTHCDFLSYVLMVKGQWLVVDSGVYEYLPGEMRRYVRSTGAHNTICIDDEEQSEIWGEFRVGRRAARIQASIEQLERRVVFDGEFKGFPTIPGGIRHRRNTQLQLDEYGQIRELTVSDRVAYDRPLDAGKRRVNSLIHLHPAIRAVVDRNCATLFRDDKVIATITASNCERIETIDSWYCPQFGVKLANCVLRLTHTASLPTECGYVISIATSPAER